MTTKKNQIIQIKSLSNKDMDDTRNRLIGIVNSNPESITLLIDKQKTVISMQS